MIKANELRIGNWIYDSSGHPAQVRHLNIEKQPLAEPIPLTAEILLKAGLKESEEWKGIWSIVLGEKKKSYFDIVQDSKGSFSYIHTPQKIKLYSLHQLQNVIFAIAGEELEIKL